MSFESKNPKNTFSCALGNVEMKVAVCGFLGWAILSCFHWQRRTVHYCFDLLLANRQTDERNELSGSYKWCSKTVSKFL